MFFELNKDTKTITGTFRNQAEFDYALAELRPLIENESLNHEWNLSFTFYSGKFYLFKFLKFNLRNLNNLQFYIFTGNVLTNNTDIDIKLTGDYPNAVQSAVKGNLCKDGVSES